MRTRQRLVDAYVQVSTPGAGVPRVSTIVRAAGVNRSSFYAHFDGVEDLTLYVLDLALADLARSQAMIAERARPATRVTALAAGRAYLDAIAANAPGLAAAVRADRAQARARIGATLQQTMLDFLSITPGWDAHSPRSVAIAAFVGHGWAGTICAWLAGELPLEMDVLLAELVALNPDPARVPQTGH